jgi:4,4'-diapolycopenoate synthase
MSADSMIEAARVAGVSWSQCRCRERRRLLSRFARTLAAHQEELVSAIVRDTEKPPLDVLGGDVLVTLEHMRFYQRHAHKVLRPRRLGRDWLLFRSTRFVQRFEPYGVVLVFGPSNYPLQLALVPAMTALYAGNAVILKLSERTPTLATVLRELIAEARLPPNLVQIVSDEPDASGEYIDAHPDFLCFTGSSANGVRVAERAARQMIPGIFELGGKDAAIVFSDCNLQRTVEGVLYGAFSNSGQVCVGIKRLYVEAPIFEIFLQKLCDRIRQLRIGSASTSERDLTPIHGPLLNRLTSQIEDAFHRGARVLNQIDDLTGATPIVLGGVPENAQLLNEESFGPVLCVDAFDHEAQAIDAANNSRFALGASLWTRDQAKAARVAARLNAANIAVNDVIRNVANPSAPFGGNSASGYGRYHGIDGLLTFSRTKTTMFNTSRSSSERNWFPLKEKTYHELSKLIRLRHGTITTLFGCLFLSWFFSQALYGQHQSGHLHLQVHLSSPSKGQLAYLIFNRAEGFPNKRDRSIRHGFLSPDISMRDIDLGELPRGRYAVSLYVDENGNHRLDSNWLGIPKEPVGASQNPRSRMGPPRFEDCAFDMSNSDLTIEINLVSPR